MSDRDIMQLTVNRQRVVDRAFDEFYTVTAEFILKCSASIMLYFLIVKVL